MANDALLIICVIIIIIACFFCCGDFYAAIKGPSGNSSQTCCTFLGFVALILWTISSFIIAIHSHYLDANDMCKFDPDEKCVSTHSKGSYTNYGKDCSSECRGLRWIYGIGYTAGALGAIAIIFMVIGFTVYHNAFSEYGIIQMLKENTNHNELKPNGHHKKNRDRRNHRNKRRDKRNRRQHRNDDDEESEDEDNYNTIAYRNTSQWNTKHHEKNINQLEIVMKSQPAPTPKRNIQQKPPREPTPPPHFTREPTPPPPVVDELEQKRAFDAYKSQIITGLVIASFVEMDDIDRMELFPQTTVDIIASYIDLQKTSHLTFFAAGFNQFGGLGALKSGSMRGRALTTMKQMQYILPSNDSDEYVVDLYTGSSYTILESNRGHLYGVGFNSNGQLGFKSHQQRRAHERMPKRIAYFDKIIVKTVFLNCTAKATFFSDYSLKIYGCGFNKNGNLGLDIAAESVPYPQHIVFFDDIHIIDMQNDYYGSIALDTGGNIYIAGSQWRKVEPMARRIRRARKRKENIEVKMPKIIQICIGGQIQFPHVLDIEGTVYRGCFSGFDVTPVKYYKENGIKIVNLFGGQSYSVALCDKGNIYQWNDLLDGKVRNQPFHDPVLNKFFVDKHVVDVKCGSDHCCVICVDQDNDAKEYYMFGRNSHNSIIPAKNAVTEPMLYDFKQKCGLDEGDEFEVRLGSSTTMVVVAGSK